MGASSTIHFLTHVQAKARTLDFITRLAFFAVAPRLLVLVAALYPVSGAVIQIGVALFVFVLAEAARELSSRSKLAHLVLSSQLEFEAYYGANPPRPFLYYVFYPLLFPYWVTQKEARREFLLFKGYTLASFAILLVSLGVQFVRFFPPELGLRQFWPIAAKTFGVETIVVLLFLMPIFTSVVHYHQARARGRLAAILLAGVVSSGFAIERLERARDPVVSLATRERVRLRTNANKKPAYDALARALGAAWKALPKERDDVDSDGKVESPLDTARTTLEAFLQIGRDVRVRPLARAKGEAADARPLLRSAAEEPAHLAGDGRQGDLPRHEAPAARSLRHDEDRGRRDRRVTSRLGLLTPRPWRCARAS